MHHVLILFFFCLVETPLDMSPSGATRVACTKSYYVGSEYLMRNHLRNWQNILL